MRFTALKATRNAGIALALSTMLLAATSTASAGVPVDIRVVTNDPAELANVRLYAPSDAKVRTYSGDDCFDPTPPFKQSSGKVYPQSTPNMLSAVDEASDAKPSLQPFRVSDADYATFGALSVCTIGAGTPPGFFFLKANHVALTTGADQTPIHAGDQLLFYRTPSDFSADEELSMEAPARTSPGVPITVQVSSIQGDGTSIPASGATVTGGDAPVSVSANGTAVVTFAAEGVHSLLATKDYNDIPSAAVSVCVAKDLVTCPPARGMEILGSHEPDTIVGTAGPDIIKARAGTDGVRALAGDDRINVVSGDKDRVNCGGGFDVVKAGKGDKIAKNCEKARRKGKKKGKSKK